MVTERGRKPELDHFPSHHDLDICLLSETFLNHVQVRRFPNYVCHRRHTDSGVRHRLSGTPSYSPTLSTSTVHDPHEG